MNNPMDFEKENIYTFTDENFEYFFNRADNYLVSISKTELTYNINNLDINNYNGINVPIEDQTKMAKFINGFIIYTKDNIYLANTNTKSLSVMLIESGYKIKDMNTDDNGNVIFYGKNPKGENIKGIINHDNTIEEIPIEYDSNGVIIENLE